MANDPSLKIRISADLKELRQALNETRAEIGKLGQNLKSTGSGNLSGLESSVNGIRRSVAQLTVAFVSLQSLRALGEMADQAATLTARLKLSTDSAKQLAVAQAGLLDIAQRTRSDLSLTVNLYSRLALATKDSNIQQGELLRLTESIGKAVALSGSSQDSANAAILQLSQGLASGTLRGEELNSVLEQTPRLAQAIAAGMGVSIGKLRQLGQDGQLTAENVLSALSNQAAVLDEEFSTIPLRISDSVQLVKNEFLTLVGDLDRATGSSSGVAGFIKNISDGIASIDFGPFIASFVSASEAASANLGDIKNLIADLAGVISEYFENNGDASEALDFFAFTIANIPAIFRAAVQRAVVEVAAFIDTVLTKTAAFKDRIAAIVSDDTFAAVDQRESARLAAIESARKDSVDAIFAEAAAHIDAGEAAKKRFQDEREARKKATEEARKALEEAKKAGSSTGIAGKRADEAPAANQAAIAAADIDNALRELDRLYAEGKVRAADYYAEKRRLSDEALALELQQIDVKIAAAEKADEKSKLLTEKADEKSKLLTEKADEKSKLLTDREIARRRAAAQSAEIAAAERAANDERLREQEKLQIELAQLEGRGAEARARELEGRYRETLERMKLEGDAAGVAIIERIISIETAKSKLAELETEYRATIDRLKGREESLSDQSEIGAISNETASQELGVARDEAILKLQQLRTEYQLLAQQDAPGAQAALDALDAKLAELNQGALTGTGLAIQSLRAQFNELNKNLAQTVANSGVDALEGLFMDLVDGSKSADQALRDFVVGFVRSMAQIAARALATFLVLQLLDAIYPGLGQVTAQGMKAGANVKHSGGVVGRGGTIRSVDASLFAAAPRYHSGGVAGLKPGEVPAILQTGEEVLSRNDPRNVTNGGGQAQGSSTRVINVIDPNMVSDYMSSSSGEETLLNVINRNAGMIKQVLS